MPSYSADDVHRSIRRHVALGLGSPPWRLAVEAKDVANRETPVGYIVPAGSPAPQRRPRTGRGAQGDVDWMWGFQGWLVPGDGASPAASRAVATETAKRFVDVFVTGLVDADGAGIGGPERIPLYDYDGVSVEPGSTGPADPYDYLWADAYSADPRQDPDDGSWSISIRLTVSWRAGGRLAPDAPVAAHMPPTFEP